LDNSDVIKKKTAVAGVTLVFRNEPARGQDTSECLVYIFLINLRINRDQYNTVTNQYNTITNLLGFVTMKQRVYCQGTPVINVSFK